jgi:hypothetical protein
MSFATARKASVSTYREPVDDRTHIAQLKSDILDLLQRCSHIQANFDPTQEMVPLASQGASTASRNTETLAVVPPDIEALFRRCVYSEDAAATAKAKMALLETLVAKRTEFERSVLLLTEKYSCARSTPRDISSMRRSFSCAQTFYSLVDRLTEMARYQETATSAARIEDGVPPVASLALPATTAAAAEASNADAMTAAHAVEMERIRGTVRSTVSALLVMAAASGRRQHDRRPMNRIESAWVGYHGSDTWITQLAWTESAMCSSEDAARALRACAAGGRNRTCDRLRIVPWGSAQLRSTGCSTMGS